MMKFNKTIIASLFIAMLFLAVIAVLKQQNNSMVSEFKKYNKPVSVAASALQMFSEIDFNDPESVVSGAMTLSDNKQCKTFFHSNGWKDLDQMEKDGTPYWNSIETLRERAKKSFYLCTFKYHSIESGVVTFVIGNDKNYNSGKGAIGPLLLVRERDGWRMALSDVGYGKDIEMFYGDWDFWNNLSDINEDIIREEFLKIREKLEETTSIK